jgi:hypothetical protein
MTFSPRMTLAAVLIAGSTAGFVVSPVAFATTIVVAALLAKGFRSSAQLAPGADQWSGFSDALRDRIGQTLQDLPEGETRRALLEIATCARSLLTSTTNAFDASHERATCQRVEQLVEVCCATALELARLDEALAAERVTFQAGPLDRLRASRQLLASRLSAASDALRRLYAADISQGSSASERVAELTRELTEDAVARTAALTELSELLASEGAARTEGPPTALA